MSGMVGARNVKFGVQTADSSREALTKKN